MTNDGFPEAEVFELGEPKLNNPIIFAGFVGAGLVGPLSVGHIIEKLNNKYSIYFEIILIC